MEQLGIRNKASGQVVFAPDGWAVDRIERFIEKSPSMNDYEVVRQVCTWEPVTS